MKLADTVEKAREAVAKHSPGTAKWHEAKAEEADAEARYKEERRKLRARPKD